jgi:hypothetical protein
MKLENPTHTPKKKTKLKLFLRIPPKSALIREPVID